MSRPSDFELRATSNARCTILARNGGGEPVTPTPMWLSFSAPPPAITVGDYGVVKINQHTDFTGVLDLGPACVQRYWQLTVSTADNQTHVETTPLATPSPRALL